MTPRGDFFPPGLGKRRREIQAFTVGRRYGSAAYLAGRACDAYADPAALQLRAAIGGAWRAFLDGYLEGFTLAAKVARDRQPALFRGLPPVDPGPELEAGTIETLPPDLSGGLFG